MTMEIVWVMLIGLFWSMWRDAVKEQRVKQKELELLQDQIRELKRDLRDSK